MNSENSKTSDPHRLLLNLSYKVNLKRTDKYVALSNLNIYFETPETMKLIESTKSKITKDESRGNVPHLIEITEVVLIYCDIDNDYQQDSRVLYTFVPNKSFGQLLDISPKNFIFLKTFNSGFPYIEVWLTDQTSKLLEIEDEINLTLVIN